jgi:HEAT repeat protein
MARLRNTTFIACILSLAFCACANREAEDLVARLKTRDAAELREITGKIVRLPNAIAVPALRQGLHSEKWRTRYMSAQLLGRFKAYEAAEELIGALSDSIGGVQAQAAEALGQLQAQEAVPHLLDLLDKTHEVVQIATANSLGQLGSTRALPSLCRLARARPLKLRAAAIRALGPCIDDSVDTLHSEQARQLIWAALDDVFADIRIAGIVALRGTAYQGAAGRLLQLLTDRSAAVQHVAVQALGEITDVQHRAWQGDTDPDMARIVSALDSVVSHTGNASIAERAKESLGRISEAARMGTPSPSR